MLRKAAEFAVFGRIKIRVLSDIVDPTTVIFVAGVSVITFEIMLS